MVLKHRRIIKIIAIFFMIITIYLFFSICQNYLRGSIFGYSALDSPMSKKNKCMFRIILFLTPNEADKIVGQIGLPLHYAVILNDEYFVKHLVKKTKDINFKSSTGKTPLYFALFRDNLTKKEINDEIVETLVLNGADVNTTSDLDLTKSTPLHKTVELKNIKLINLLLLHGANPNQPNSDGQTPLHIAVSSGNLEITELLLKHKANPLIKDKKNKTPMDYAIINNDSKMEELLKKYCPKNDSSGKSKTLNLIQAVER